MSDTDSTQSASSAHSSPSAQSTPSAPSAPSPAESPEVAGCTSFEDVLELLSEHFTSDDSSARHARLNVKLPEGTQPVMVYLGTSSLEASREVVNIASPLLDVSGDKAYDIASQMDAMPLGALRRLGGILHIHEVLAFGEFTSETLISCIRLIAAQAFSLRSSRADSGATSSDNAHNEGGQ